MTMLSRRLAESLVTAASTPLSATDAHFAKLFVLDWLGCAVAGIPTPPGRMLIEEGSERGAGPCRVLGVERGRDAETAALINGALSHIVEMDDLDRGSVVHPGCVVIPAALAAAEQTGSTGERFLRAVVIGYEAAIRVGEAVGRSHYRFWQNTATCGAYGAAAAAGLLYGLDAERFTHAFGNAGSVAGGLWEFNRDGAMTKHLHAGRAAANGLLAASLARRGFTGASAILEGPQGFFAAMSDDAQPERFVDGLESGLGDGSPWKIRAVSIKPHASCRHTHPAVDAALRLRASIADPAAIEAVRVETYATALQVTDNPRPTNAYQAKFSLQYCTALALLRGHAGLADFDEASLADPALRAFMERITLAVDPALDAGFPRSWAARVTVQIPGGAFSDEVDAPKGDPENPVTWDEAVQKFSALCASILPAAGITRLVEEIDGLQRRTNMRAFLPLIERR